MVYDSQGQRSLLFSGDDRNGTSNDTWTYAASNTSTATTFGAGCGSPALSLTPVSNTRPAINSTAQASLTNVPSALVFVALGWSRSVFGPFSLPHPLTGYGMPGCELLQSADIDVPAVATGPGTATYSLPLPNWPGLIGLHIYLQGWASAPGANSASLIVSNGLEWFIGT